MAQPLPRPAPLAMSQYRNAVALADEAVRQRDELFHALVALVGVLDDVTVHSGVPSHLRLRVISDPALIKARAVIAKTEA